MVASRSRALLAPQAWPQLAQVGITIYLAADFLGGATAGVAFRSLNPEEK